MDRDKCVIAMPVGGKVENKTDQALRELERRGYAVRRVYGYSAIDQGRSQIATDALKDGFDEIFWIDSDIVFEPDDVDKIRAHELPFCCGIYPKKGPRAFAFNFKKETKAVKFGRNGGLLEIARAGMGFTHTRREVYEKIKATSKLPVCNERWGEALVPYFMPMLFEEDGLHDYLAEDFAFSERARTAGFAIMADTSVRLWHVGSFEYGWEEAGRDVQRFGDYTFNVW